MTQLTQKRHGWTFSSVIFCFVARSCAFVFVFNVPLCFLFYFGIAVLSYIPCPVRFPSCSFACPDVFYLDGLSHLRLITPFIFSLCVSLAVLTLRS